MRIILVMAAIVMALGPSVRADDNEAEAEQLFRDARALMQQGKYAAACASFETSQKLAPTVSTLLNLADCLEKNGQLASAWTAFLEADRETRADAKQAALNKTAKERAANLEPRLSYLTVSVPDESRVEGLALTRNDEPFDEGLWNRAIPVDGGDYKIGGSAPAHEEWSTTVHVPQENGRVSVDVPKFKEVAKLVAPPVQAEPVAKPGGTVTKSVPPSRSSSVTGRRKLALVVGGVGGLALGGAIVLGLQAKGFENDADAKCPSNPCGANADAANALVDKAKQRALFANIGYGVAGGAAIGAALLWLIGNPATDHDTLTLAPMMGPRFVGFSIDGRL